VAFVLFKRILSDNARLRIHHSRADVFLNLDIRLSTFHAWMHHSRSDEILEGELDLNIKYYKRRWPAPHGFVQILRETIREELASSAGHVPDILPSVSIRLCKLIRTCHNPQDLAQEEVSVCVQLRGPNSSITRLSELQLLKLNVMGYHADEVYCPLHQICESCHSSLATDSNVCTQCGTKRRSPLHQHSIPSVARTADGDPSVTPPTREQRASLSAGAAAAAVVAVQSRRTSSASAVPSQQRPRGSISRGSISTPALKEKEPEGAPDIRLDKQLRLRVMQLRGEDGGDDVFRVDKGVYKILGKEVNVMLKGEQQVLVRKGATWIPLHKWLEQNFDPSPRGSVAGSVASSRPSSPGSQTREARGSSFGIAAGLTTALHPEAAGKRNSSSAPRASLSGSTSSPTLAGAAPRTSLSGVRQSLLQVPGRAKATAKGRLSTSTPSTPGGSKPPSPRTSIRPPGAPAKAVPGKR